MKKILFLITCLIVCVSSAYIWHSQKKEIATLTKAFNVNFPMHFFATNMNFLLYEPVLLDGEQEEAVSNLECIAVSSGDFWPGYTRNGFLKNCERAQDIMSESKYSSVRRYFGYNQIFGGTAWRVNPRQVWEEHHKFEKKENIAISSIVIFILSFACLVFCSFSFFVKNSSDLDTQETS